MNQLKNLEPALVFRYFEEICGIPHGSGNTKAISDYCAAFARSHNLDYIQDSANNIIIFKGGTVGYETSAPVMIQGHLDMVCEKNAGYSIDFKHDGLTLEVDGDDITAKNTTLGGDDGIAVAYCLAILDDDTISHPPLEIVFTVDEEIGMLGAAALDCTPLHAKTMLNLDSEDEGILLAGCAGGVTATCRLPIKRIPYTGQFYTLTIAGLTGGHSGVEIDKGRANANQLMGRILCGLSQKTGLLLADIYGGQKDNAIPREAEASFVLTDSMFSTEQLNAYIRQCADTLKKEFKNTDNRLDIQLNAARHDSCDKQNVMDPESTANVIAALRQLPCGVIRMSQDIEGLVQTSLNLGILTSDADNVTFIFSVRSSKADEKTQLISQMEALMESFNGNVTQTGDYPAWEYLKESKLKDLMVNIFKSKYGYPPEIQAIHAGVECGLFVGKMPGLDCISYGPNMQNIHTPNERLSISSVKRTWEYTLEILKQLK